MQEKPEGRPNFLVIITDQHRPDHCGFYGNPTIRTPNLDGLAARGTRFDKAYVANPICMPNRASIFTGRLPSAHGTRVNGVSLDPRARTFAHVLREAGYSTGFFGKAHFQHMAPHGGAVPGAVIPDASAGDSFLDTLSPGWNGYENAARHQAEYVKMPDDFYGFGKVELAIGHADAMSGHYYHWAAERGVKLADHQGPAKALPYTSVTQQVWRTSLPEEVYPTRFTSERTEAFLREQASAGSPFLAVCSFPDPHHPFTPPGRYFDMYDPGSMSLPETFHDPHEGSMLHIKLLASVKGQERGFVAPFAPTEEMYREMAAREFGAISLIDDAVGDVLQTLEETGLAENTIVIFTSDHGEMFGDHGLMLKGAMHYDGCIRVPLVIATPDGTASSTSDLASSLDLAPTILEMAGLPLYYGLQGKSLAPSVAGTNEAPERNALLIEEDELVDIFQTGRGLRMRSIVTPTHRLTLYEGTPEGELFDLREDPGETRNLFADPQSTKLRAELTELLSRELMKAADLSPIPTGMA